MAKKGSPDYVQNVIALDFETGGLSPQDNPVTEIAAVAIHGKTFKEIGRYEALIEPYGDMEITPKALEWSNLTVKKLEKEGIPIEEGVVGLVDLFKKANTAGPVGYRPIIMAHNAQFDAGFLQQIFQGCGEDLSKLIAGKEDVYGNFYPLLIDTVTLARLKWPIPLVDIPGHTLEQSCEKAGVELFEAHRAMQDVEAMIELYKHIVNSMRYGQGEGFDEAVEKQRHRKTFQF